MIKSMTGFGKAALENDDYSISVEIKSLNSKFLELNLRLPKHLNDKELETRNLFSEKLIRGKVNVFIEFDRKSKEVKPKNKINTELMKAYYDQLREASNVVGEPNYNLFNIALNMPNVQEFQKEEEDTEGDWAVVKSVIQSSLEKIEEFRTDEGDKLEKALTSYITSIGNELSDIEKEEGPRKEACKSKIQTQLEELNQKYDENRFEQELIFYLEKLDIEEEKVRLRSHLEYFIKELKEGGSGKKLGFIAQEIGREVNTIGSKANYAPIQHKVVQMKEELEKIKEQVLNLV